MSHEIQPTNVSLESSVTVPDHVVYRPFPAETVLLNLQTGKYHGLNPTGGRMLEVVQESDTVSAAAAALAKEYGQPVEAVQHDLWTLCSQLAERGLVQIDGPAED